MKQQTKTLAVASLIAVPLTMAGTSGTRADVIGNPISAQIGAGFLTSSTAKDDTESTGIHAGLSVNLPSKSLISGTLGKPSIDLDYNHNSGHGNHVDVFGLSYDERIKLLPTGVPTPKGGAVPYVGLGIGAFDDSVSKNISKTATTSSSTGSSTVTTSTTTTSSQSKSDWRLGGKLIAGVDFGQEFVEASYAISGDVNGVRTDAVNLAIGVHF